MRLVRLPSVRRGARRTPPGRGGSGGRAGRLAVKGAVSALLRSQGEVWPPQQRRGEAAAAAFGPAGEAMAAPAPGAGAASGGAGCSSGGGSGGGGAGSGSGSGSAGAGGRLPSRVLELVFSYLELSELRSCALVCKHWYRCLHGDENSEVWRSLCARSLAEEALRTDILCNLPSYKAKVREPRATPLPSALLLRTALSASHLSFWVRRLASPSRLSTAPVNTLPHPSIKILFSLD